MEEGIDSSNYGDFPPCTRLKIAFTTVTRDRFTNVITTLTHVAYVYAPIQSISVGSDGRGVRTIAYGQQYYLSYNFCTRFFTGSDYHGGFILSSSYTIEEGYPPDGWYD